MGNPPSCATGPTAACFRLVASWDRGHSNNGSVNMINNHFPTFVGALVVLVALSASANAAESAAHPAGHIPERPAVATIGNTAEAEAILGAKAFVLKPRPGTGGLPKTGGAPIHLGFEG